MFSEDSSNKKNNSNKNGRNHSIHRPARRRNPLASTGKLNAKPTATKTILPASEP